MSFAAAAQTSRSSFAVRRGLPALTGTPSQIQWAETIRERLIRGVERQIRSGQGYERTAARQRLREWIAAHTEARWWIDNRDKKPSTVVRARYAELIEVYRIAFSPLSPAPRKESPCSCS